jgi:hypothetical protein
MHALADPREHDLNGDRNEHGEREQDTPLPESGSQSKQQENDGAAALTVRRSTAGVDAAMRKHPAGSSNVVSGASRTRTGDLLGAITPRRGSLALVPLGRRFWTMSDPAAGTA